MGFGEASLGAVKWLFCFSEVVGDFEGFGDSGGFVEPEKKLDQELRVVWMVWGGGRLAREQEQKL